VAVDCSDCVYLCRFCHCLLMICWYLRQSDRASSSLLWSWRWHRYTDWYWRTICLQDFVDGRFSECEYRCVSVCVSAWCRPSGPFFNAGCIMYNISIFYFTFYLFVGGVRTHSMPHPTCLVHTVSRTYIPGFIQICSGLGELWSKNPFTTLAVDALSLQ